MKTIILVLFFMMSTSVIAAPNVAVVTLIRGQVQLLTLGKTEALKKDSWVKQGDVVKTGQKSFVKLVFIDKSQMNIGPNAEMKIEKFSGKDSGVIDLVKGQIRSQVSKDYMQMKEKDKSKIFIKTSNAVLGIRGTDFLVGTNGRNTFTVLFEGEVKFSKIERGDTRREGLEDIVNRGVTMRPGEFSVVDAAHRVPTEPALINIKQKENLIKNETFDNNRVPSASQEDSQKSVVPAGLDGKIVSNSPDELKKELGRLGTSNEAPKGNPDGFIKGEVVKPTNGSFLHIESGTIIPPGPGSILDENSNTYIASPEAGKVAADGTYLPPKNVEITAQGKIIVETIGANGEKIKQVTHPEAGLARDPSAADGKPRNDVLDPRFVPGGLNDINNFDRNRNGGFDPNNRPQDPRAPGGPLRIDIIKR